MNVGGGGDRHVKGNDMVTSLPRVSPPLNVIPYNRSNDTVVLSLEEQAQVERLLSERLVQGFCLLERACPACSTPLIKKSLPSPAAAKVERREGLNDLPSLAAVKTDSSMESTSSQSATSSQELSIAPGVAFCVKCQAHVVSEAAETKLLDQFHARREKGHILVTIPTMTTMGTVTTATTTRRDSSVAPTPPPTVGIGGAETELQRINGNEMNPIRHPVLSTQKSVQIDANMDCLSYQQEEFEVMLAATKTAASIDDENDQPQKEEEEEEEEGEPSTSVTTTDLVDHTDLIKVSPKIPVVYDPPHDGASSLQQQVWHMWHRHHQQHKLPPHLSAVSGGGAVAGMTGSLLLSAQPKGVVVPGTSPIAMSTSSATTLTPPVPHLLVPTNPAIAPGNPTVHIVQPGVTVRSSTSSRRAVVQVEEIDIADCAFEEDISLLGANTAHEDTVPATIGEFQKRAVSSQDGGIRLAPSHITAVDLAIQRSMSFARSSVSSRASLAAASVRLQSAPPVPERAGVGPTMISTPPTMIDFPMPEFKVRRGIAIKVLAAKMVQGYKITESTQCGDCRMPLMHLTTNDMSEKKECFVCHALRKQHFKSLTEQASIPLNDILGTQSLPLDRGIVRPQNCAVHAVTVCVHGEDITPLPKPKGIFSVNRNTSKSTALGFDVQVVQPLTIVDEQQATTKSLEETKQIPFVGREDSIESVRNGRVVESSTGPHHNDPAHVALSIDEPSSIQQRVAVDPLPERNDSDKLTVYLGGFRDSIDPPPARFQTSSFESPRPAISIPSETADDSTLVPTLERDNCLSEERQLEKDNGLSEELQFERDSGLSKERHLFKPESEHEMSLKATLLEVQSTANDCRSSATIVAEAFRESEQNDITVLSTTDKTLDSQLVEFSQHEVSFDEMLDVVEVKSKSHEKAGEFASFIATPAENYSDETDSNFPVTRESDCDKISGAVPKGSGFEVTLEDALVRESSNNTETGTEQVCTLQKLTSIEATYDESSRNTEAAERGCTPQKLTSVEASYVEPCHDTEAAERVCTIQKNTSIDATDVSEPAIDQVETTDEGIGATDVSEPTVGQVETTDERMEISTKHSVDYKRLSETFDVTSTSTTSSVSSTRDREGEEAPVSAPSGSVPFEQSSSTIAPTASELFEERWTILRAEARSIVTRRMLSGWEILATQCQGAECNSFPLIMKEGEKRCVVCGGSGSGIDAVYEYSFSSHVTRLSGQSIENFVSPLDDGKNLEVFPIKANTTQKNHISFASNSAFSMPSSFGASTPLSSPSRTLSSPMQRHGFWSNQKVPSATDTATHAQSPAPRSIFGPSRDMVRIEIGRRLLEGWTLLDKTCPECVMPVMTDKLKVHEICTVCGIVGKVNRDTIPDGQSKPKSKSSDANASRSIFRRVGSMPSYAESPRPSSTGRSVQKPHGSRKIRMDSDFEGEPKIVINEDGVLPTSRNNHTSPSRTVSFAMDQKKLRQQLSSAEKEKFAQWVSAVDSEVRTPRSLERRDTLTDFMGKGPHQRSKSLGKPSKALKGSGKKELERSPACRDLDGLVVSSGQLTDATTVHLDVSSGQLTDATTVHLQNEASYHVDAKPPASAPTESIVSSKQTAAFKPLQKSSLSDHDSDPRDESSKKSSYKFKETKSTKGADSLADVWPWIYALKTNLDGAMRRGDPPASSDGYSGRALDRSTKPEPPECLSICQDSPRNDFTDNEVQALSSPQTTKISSETRTDSILRLEKSLEKSEQKEASSGLEHDVAILETTKDKIASVHLPEKRSVQASANDVISRIIDAAKAKPRQSISGITVNTDARSSVRRIPSPGLSVANLPHTLTSPASSAISASSRSRAPETERERETPTKLAESPASNRLVHTPTQAAIQFPAIPVTSYLSSSSPEQRSRSSARGQYNDFSSSYSESPVINPFFRSTQPDRTRAPSPGLSTAPIPAIKSSSSGAGLDDVTPKAIDLTSEEVAESPTISQSVQLSYSNPMDIMRAPSPGMSAATPIPVMDTTQSEQDGEIQGQSKLQEPMEESYSPESPSVDSQHSPSWQRMDQRRAPSPGQSAAPIPANYSSSSSVYSSSTSSGTNKSATQNNRPRITPETTNRSRLNSSSKSTKQPTRPGHVPGNPTRGRIPTRAKSSSVGVLMPKKIQANLSTDAHSESRLEHKPPVIDVELFRKSSRRWREGRDEVIIVGPGFDEKRQNDADTLDALLLRIEKTKSQLAETSDDHDGVESQHKLRGLIDNLARAAEQMQQIDKS